MLCVLAEKSGYDMRYAAQKNPKVKKNMSDKVFEAQKLGQERR